MLRRALFAGLVVALALATLPAAAQQMDNLGTKAGRVSPGAFLEQNVRLNGGDRITWSVRWEPAGERAFYDIHSHPNNVVMEYDNGTVQGGASGVFVVPSTGIYSWLVENVASGRALDATIVTQGTTSAGQGIAGPDLVLVAAGAVAAAGLAARRRA